MKRKVIIALFIIIAIISVNILIQKDVQAVDNEDTIFSEDISWEWNYYSEKDTDTMPYGEFVPSTADELESVPLIVWLHGSGEVFTGESNLKSTGLPATISNWQLEGFSAYILCPHLTGSYSGTWYDSNAISKFTKVVDKYIEEHNIDENNIIIIGHSMGGKGALYMAQNMPGYFSKCVVLSGYITGYPLSSITIPTICYVGNYDAETCRKQAQLYFEPEFGEENVCWLDGATHGAVPKLSLEKDDGNFVRIRTEMVVLI